MTEKADGNYYLFKSSKTGEPLEMVLIRFPKWDKERIQNFFTEARAYTDKELPDGSEFEKLKLAIDILGVGGINSVKIVDWANDDVLYF